MSFTIRRIDHVQMAIPVGGEPEAEAFYAGILGFEIQAKPAAMAVRGGRWFACNGVQIHVGIEEDFRPARKAHPAIVVGDLDDLVEHLANTNISVRWSDEVPGTRRCFVDDPFGNRIELIEG